MNLASFKNLHPWKVSTEEAKEIQKKLASDLKFTVLGKLPRLIAGVDSAFIQNGEEEYIITVIVVLSFPELELVEKKFLTNRVTFPYIPTLLSFREGPSFIKTWKRLNNEPEIVFFDGQGIAHPRLLGMAAHLGLWIDRPTIGVAKSRLFGIEERTPIKKGEWHPLLHPEDRHTIGAVVCTKDAVAPLYISPGNYITLEDSIRLVLSCISKQKLPEPTRLAHLLTEKIKKEKKSIEPHESED
jgi:deoxyribonuclease V